MLTEKGVLRDGYGNKEGKGMLKTGYRSPIKKNLIPLDPLTNFKI